MNAQEQWDSMGWENKERFLIRHGFKTGWSSHTWKRLDRPIQSVFTEKQDLINQLRQNDSELSPENLTCDGERSRASIIRAGAILRRQRRGIIARLGYEPTVLELYPK